MPDPWFVVFILFLIVYTVFEQRYRIKKRRERCEREEGRRRDDANGDP